jgi:G3E family GTPase
VPGAALARQSPPPRAPPQHLDAICASEPGAINEAAQQLAFADLILLNKTDLVSAEQLDRVKAVVRDINQNAKQIECRLNQEGGQPPLSELLDSNAFSVHKALKVRPRARPAAQAPTHPAARPRAISAAAALVPPHAL